MAKKEKFVGYIMLILGSTIGAGLASGQEIVIFFAKFGYVSIIFAVFFILIFAYSIYTLLNYGRLISLKPDFIKKYKNEYIFESSYSIIFLVFSSTMIAGADSLLNEILLNTKFHLWSIIILIICACAVLKGLKCLVKINLILVPLIVVSTLLVCFLSFNFSSHSAVTFSFDATNLAFLTASIILYSSCNIMVSSKILISIGSKINEKNAKKLAILCASILGAIIVLIIVALLINDSSLLFAELPLVFLAFTINEFAGYAYSIIILICIITTLLSTFFSLKENLKNKISNNVLSTIIACLCIFILSLFGFENIVRFSYPIIGALGVVLIYNLNSRINYLECKCKV